MFGSVFPHWKFSLVQSCGFLENSPTLLHFSLYWLISTHVKDSLSWERMTLENIRESLPINAPLRLCAYFHHPTPFSIIWFLVHCIVMVHLFAYPVLPVSKQLEGKYHILLHCLGNRGHSRYFFIFTWWVDFFSCLRDHFPNFNRWYDKAKKITLPTTKKGCWEHAIQRICWRIYSVIEPPHAQA